MSTLANSPARPDAVPIVHHHPSPVGDGLHGVVSELRLGNVAVV